jgi:hypothetical protein
MKYRIMAAAALTAAAVAFGVTPAEAAGSPSYCAVLAHTGGSIGGDASFLATTGQIGHDLNPGAASPFPEGPVGQVLCTPGGGFPS